MARAWIYDEDAGNLLEQADYLLCAISLITRKQSESQEIKLHDHDLSVINFLAREAIGKIGDFETMTKLAAEHMGSTANG